MITASYVMVWFLCVLLACCYGVAIFFGSIAVINARRYKIKYGKPFWHNWLIDMPTHRVIEGNARVIKAKQVRGS